MIADSGARFAFVDDAWHAAISAAVLGGNALRDAVAFGSPAYAAMANGNEAASLAPVRRGRRGVALLHERHDRAAEGRRDHARQPLRDDARVPRRRVAGGARRRDPASRAAVPRVRPVRRAPRGARRGERRAGIGRLRSGRDRGAHTVVARCGLLRRTDDGQAPRRVAGDRRARRRAPEGHRVRRRPDVRRRLQGGVRGAGPAPRADLRAGRVADDDHSDGPRGARRRDRARRRCIASGRSAPRSSASSCASAASDDAGLAGGRGRRSAGAGTDGDARVLGECRGDARRRSRTAGCTPATSARSTPTASSRSRTARRT